jgi:hypothetical protein
MSQKRNPNSPDNAVPRFREKSASLEQGVLQGMPPTNCSPSWSSSLEELAGEPWTMFSPSIKEHYRGMLKEIWNQARDREALRLLREDEIADVLEEVGESDERRWKRVDAEGTVYFEEGGLVRVSFELDLRRHRNSAVAASFTKALQRMRSSLVAEDAKNRPPSHRGAQNQPSDALANLRYLCALRLRHSMPVETIASLEMKADYRFWRQPASSAISKKAQQRDLENEIRQTSDQMRRKARQRYRQFFPKLGENAYPEHWSTYRRNLSS